VHAIPLDEPHFAGVLTTQFDRAKRVGRDIRVELLPSSADRVSAPERTCGAKDAKAVPAAASCSESSYRIVQPVNVRGVISGILRRPQKGNFGAVVPADIRYFLGFGREDDIVEYTRFESSRDGICQKRVRTKDARVLSGYPFRARPRRNETYY
jgi:hypothetical protein